jgi:arylsulfatase
MLHELQQLFAREATANDVLLHNPTPENMRFPSLTGDRTRFSYRAGTIGVAEKEAPNTKTRSHAIEARLGVPPGGARGVLATLGGRSAGWSLYLDAQGVPVYRLRIFDVEELTLRGSGALPAGEHVLRVEFAARGASRVPGGTLRLLVNGTETARGEVKRTATMYSIDETFDIGLDTGSSPADYRAPFPFTGTLERVDVELL